MNLYRLLIRRLAKRYLDEAFEAGVCAARIGFEMKRKIESTADYLRGHADGQKMVWEALEKEVRTRQLEEMDINNAKKGMIH